MENDLISVLVPVYNAQHYIRECLDSIIAQSLKNFELVIIDDGSTDDSGRICEEYSQRDDRIRVIHQENAGRSAARNRGLDEAKGNYICFIDADDTVKPDYLEKLFDIIRLHNVELSICDCETTKLPASSNEYDDLLLLRYSEAKSWLYDQYSRENVLMVVPWGKIYAKRLFDDLRYPLERIHEDEFIVGAVLGRCKLVGFTSEKLYIYRDNEEGITSDANKMDIRHLDAVDALVERTSQALLELDRDFALVTLRNALYKCVRFYREAKETGNEEMKTNSMTKYREVYFRYKYLLTAGQMAKYLLGLAMPELFIRMYNP